MQLVKLVPQLALWRKCYWHFTCTICLFKCPDLPTTQLSTLANKHLWIPLCTLLSKLKLIATKSISCQERIRLLLFVNVFVINSCKVGPDPSWLSLPVATNKCSVGPEQSTLLLFVFVFVFVINSCNIGLDPSRLSLPVAANKCNVRFSELLPSAFTRSKEKGLQQVINCPT